MLGVLAFRMPETGLAAILDSASGSARPARRCWSASDGLLRVNSPFTEADDRMAAAYTASSVDAALTTGKIGTAQVTAYRSMPMMTAAAPVAFMGSTWAPVATIADAEALAPVGAAWASPSFILGGLVVAGAGILGWLFSRTITGPVTRLTAHHGGAGRRRSFGRGQGRRRPDELGAMARAVQVFRENARAASPT